MNYINRILPIILWFAAIGYLLNSAINNIEFYIENGIIRLLWLSHVPAYLIGYGGYRVFTSGYEEITRPFTASSNRGSIHGEIGTGRFIYAEFEDKEKIIGYNAFFYTTLFVAFFAKYALAAIMFYLIGIFVFMFIIKMLNKISLFRRTLFLVSFAFPISNIVFLILMISNAFFGQPKFMESVYSRIQSVQ